MAKWQPLRLLFDEQMSVTVARALAVLGKQVTHVGRQRQPKKGTDDPSVADAAKREQRVLATFNFDMVLSAIEGGTRVLWFDQRGRSPTRMETALILLRQWDAWEKALSDVAVPCLKVGRDSIEVLSVEQAHKRALRRFRENQQAANRSKASDTRQLLMTFEDEE